MTPWFSSIAYIAARSLGLALLHSIWQGAILYFLLRIVLAMFKNISAAAKYAISYSAFSILSVWFIYTWATLAQAYIPTYNALQAPLYTGIPYTTTSLHTASTNNVNNMLHIAEHYLPLFWYVYIPGLLLMIARLKLNIFSIHTYRTRGIVSQNEWQAMLQQLQHRIGITGKIQIYLSAKVNVPVMMGVLKPFILLPVHIVTQLTDAQLEAILMHELAHIKRHDYLLNLLQVFIETVLFFNPFIWLISSAIRRERELCCDDMVVAYTHEPYHYATALHQLELYRTPPAAALAATGNKNYLLTRIKRIIEMKKKPSAHHYIPGIILVALLALIPLFWLTPGFAQKIKNDKDGTGKKVKKVIIINNADTVKQYNADVISNKDEEDDENSEGRDDLVVIRKNSIIINADSISTCLKAAMDAIGNIENSEEVKQVITNAKKQLEESKKQMAYSKVQIDDSKQQIENAKKQLDEAKIQVANSRKQIACGKKQTSARAIKNIEIHIDDDGIKEIENKINSIDWVGIGNDIADAMTNVHIEISANDGDHKVVKKEIRTIPQGRHTTSPYDHMLQTMQADGLIDRDGVFKVEKDGNQLYINGDKQPRSVYNKYSSYIDGNQVTITGRKDRLKIIVKD